MADPKTTIAERKNLTDFTQEQTTEAVGKTAVGNAAILVGDKGAKATGSFINGIVKLFKGTPLTAEEQAAVNLVRQIRNAGSTADVTAGSQGLKDLGARVASSAMEDALQASKAAAPVVSKAGIVLRYAAWPIAIASMAIEPGRAMFGMANGNPEQTGRGLAGTVASGVAVVGMGVAAIMGAAALPVIAIGVGVGVVGAVAYEYVPGAKEFFTDLGEKTNRSPFGKFCYKMKTAMSGKPKEIEQDAKDAAAKAGNAIAGARAELDQNLDGLGKEGEKALKVAGKVKDEALKAVGDRATKVFAGVASDIAEAKEGLDKTAAGIGKEFTKATNGFQKFAGNLIGDVGDVFKGPNKPVQVAEADAGAKSARSAGMPKATEGRVV